MKPRSGVRWLAWSGDAFRRAEMERKPVLLSLVTAWCEVSALMDRASYADPAIVAAVESDFVPVRVDADRRPDIAERYNLGGWPTTAFLTPDGDILGGGTYFGPDRLPAALAQVREAFATRGAEIAARAGELAGEREAARSSPARGPARLDAGAIRWLERTIVAEFDPAHGGFGRGARCPDVPVLMFALRRARATADPRLLDVVVRALDAMAASPLYDPVEGGFFRYSEAPDWRRPHTEKILDLNAALLGAYSEAAAALGHSPYRDRAIGIVRFVTNTLTDPDGGFFASRRADAAYYAPGALEERQARPAPPVDRTLFTDWNAAMVAAYLRAADLLGEPSLREPAIRSLERILLATYRPGHGVAHAFDGEVGVRGLLTDHVHASAALIAAYHATDNVAYSMLAEELMHVAIRTMWDDERGGFFDRAASVDDRGRLREPLKPFALNCDAARVLGRLASIGDPEFRPRAVDALASQTGAYRLHGLAAASYGLALDELTAPAATDVPALRADLCEDEDAPVE